MISWRLQPLILSNFRQKYCQGRDGEERELEERAAPGDRVEQVREYPGEHAEYCSQVFAYLLRKLMSTFVHGMQDKSCPPCARNHSESQ